MIANNPAQIRSTRVCRLSLALFCRFDFVAFSPEIPSIAGLFKVFAPKEAVGSVWEKIAMNYVHLVSQ
jgi:hypothetical protein